MPCLESSTQSGDTTNKIDESVDDNEFEYFHLAKSLLDECLAHVSLANLNNVVFLVQEFYLNPPASARLRFQALNVLASVLAIISMQAKDSQHFSEVLKLEKINMQAREMLSDMSYDGDGSDSMESLEMLALAQTILDEFAKLTSLSTINSAIFLLQLSLQELSVAHPMHPSIQVYLAYATYMLFRHSGKVVDLDSAIRIVGGNVSQPGPDGTQENLDDLLQLLTSVLAPKSSNANNATTELFESSSSTMQPEDFGGLVYSFEEDISSLLHANTLMDQFESSGNMVDLEECIRLTRLGLEKVSPHSTNFDLALDNLGIALRTRYKQTGATQDLEEGISLHRRVLKLRPRSHPQRATSLNNLANGLFSRYQVSGDTKDLDDAISLHEQALKLRTTTGPESLSSLINLAAALLSRFNQRGNIQDLDDAISFYYQALELPDLSQTHQLGLISNLAAALVSRFENDGDKENLEAGLFFCRRALELTPPSHPSRPSALTSLASVLSTKFDQEGNPQDLEGSISSCREALTLLPPHHVGRSMCLHILGAGLLIRFHQSSDSGDLEEAILSCKEALQLRPSAHPDRPMSLHNLAAGLLARFVLQGELEDVDKAILCSREVLQIMPSHHPQFHTALNNLSSSLLGRFRRLGYVKDLDEAISTYRQALELTPPSHPNRAVSTNDLAIGLSTRYRQRDDSQDLEEAIFLYKQSCELLPHGHPGHPDIQNNLGEALLTRFRRHKDVRDLNEAISLHRNTLACRTPCHHGHIMSMNNLANALYAKYLEADAYPYLDEAILLYKQALKLMHFSHSSYVECLDNLVKALSTRFRAVRVAEDFDEGVQFSREALEGLPVDHRARPLILFELAGLYISAYHGNAPNSDHLEQAIQLYSEATLAQPQPPSSQFTSVKAWAYFADLYQHPSALDAFEIALGIIPEMATISMDIQSRQEILLEESDGMARRGARLAIHTRRFDKAVEFLEAGRSIFWSQFLALRSPLDRLYDISPKLATDLRSVSKDLEQGAYRDRVTSDMPNHQKLSMEDEAFRLAGLAAERTQIINKIRELTGFEDFLKPQKLSTLQTAADASPIVYLVANDDVSDCLVLTSTDVHHIPLPLLGQDMLTGFVYMLKLATSEHRILRSEIEDTSLEELSKLSRAALGALRSWTSERGMRRKTAIPHCISSDDIFEFVLDKLWMEVVKPVIQYLGLEKSDKRSKVTWCPTGIFSFLPIHAAGHYEKGEASINCASDYIISSYTPTIGTLLTRSSQNIFPTPEDFKMMVVIQSQTLPSTHEELKKIEQHVPRDSLIKFGTKAIATSVDSVAASLSSVSAVHFACHGKQDFENPLKSGLEIEGDRLTIARIMKESVPNGSLAFLSACETAMGDANIPDEALNIGASLLFTGFQSVVATMWRMWDADGPAVTEVFYRELFRDETIGPDIEKSAEALDIAVRELRSRGVAYKRWVPFIHMGK